MAKFDEDAYRDRQLHKYLEENTGEMSNCCDAPICEESDVCCECKEHCVTNNDAKEMARDDYGDQKMEEARDGRDS